MGQVSAGSIVADVAGAIAFYTEMLGFTVETHPAPGFASLARGDLRLLLNRPGAGGAGPVMADRQAPVPGGGDRIQLAAAGLGSTDGKLRGGGSRVPKQPANRL